MSPFENIPETAWTEEPAVVRCCVCDRQLRDWMWADNPPLCLDCDRESKRREPWWLRLLRWVAR